MHPLDIDCEFDIERAALGMLVLFAISQAAAEDPA
jgi:hypothetical protein